MRLVRCMGALRGTGEHLVYLSVWCGCLRTLLANRGTLLNKYPSVQRHLIQKKNLVLVPLCLKHPHVWPHPLKSVEAMMWFNLYICMDIYCIGANQNSTIKMSEMIGTWKTWSKIIELVCQLWQGHYLQQCRLNHLEDNTETAVGTREHCTLALYAYNRGNTKRYFLVCRRLPFLSLLPKSIRGLLNLGDTGVVI